MTTYTVTVSRASSSDAELVNIEVTPGTLKPSFSSSVERYEVGNLREIISLTVTAKDNQTVTANDDITLTSGVGTDFNLAYGTNPIGIEVTAADGMTTKGYVVTAMRPVILDRLELAGLKSANGTPVDYTFDPFVNQYRVTVANDSSDLTVAPAVDDNSVGYTISESDNELMQTDGRVSIPFNVGQTRVISVELTAAEWNNQYLCGDCDSRSER